MSSFPFQYCHYQPIPRYSDGMVAASAFAVCDTATSISPTIVSCGRLFDAITPKLRRAVVCLLHSPPSYLHAPLSARSQTKRTIKPQSCDILTPIELVVVSPRTRLRLACSREPTLFFIINPLSSPTPPADTDQNTSSARFLLVSHWLMLSTHFVALIWFLTYLY